MSGKIAPTPEDTSPKSDDNGEADTEERVTDERLTGDSDYDSDESLTEEQRAKKMENLEKMYAERDEAMIQKEKEKEANRAKKRFER